jgi:hypothetical protein
LSTTNACPSALPSLSATARAATSVEPPGGYGTMKRTDLAGHPWAWAVDRECCE